MKRIAVAGFSHETNTFSPIPTTFDSFASTECGGSGLMETEELLEFLKMNRRKRMNIASLGFASVMELLGYEIVPILVTYTAPSAQIPADVFERIVGMITRGIKARGPFDGVFLDLHGAMVYEDFQDGETDILDWVRAVVGEIPVVGSFDLHGNISEECVRLASALVGCRTYPHIDMYETGQRCAHLMQHLLVGKPLFKAYRLLPFLWPVSVQTTFAEPCQSVYALIDEAEKRPEVLSATIMAGFPAADIEHMGPTIFTYGLSQPAADAAADFLLQAILAREGEFRSMLPGANEVVRQALAMARAMDRPVILADIMDNAGGGASSDTVEIVEELLNQDAQEAAVGLIYDPASAEAAYAAGEGATVELEIGGKLVPGHHPLMGVFTIEKLHQGEFASSSPMNSGMPINLGKMAHLRFKGVHLVLSSVRTQANDRGMFRAVGIEPEKMKLIVVKSANHYRADFQPIAGAILPFEGQGANIENPEHALYKNLRDGVRLQGLGRVHKRSV